MVDSTTVAELVIVVCVFVLSLWVVSDSEKPIPLWQIVLVSTVVGGVCLVPVVGPVLALFASAAMLHYLVGQDDWGACLRTAFLSVLLAKLILLGILLYAVRKREADNGRRMQQVGELLKWLARPGDTRGR